MDDSNTRTGFEDQSESDHETSANFGKNIDRLFEQAAKTGPQGAAGADAAAQAERSDQLTDPQEYQNNAGSESCNTDPLNLQCLPLSSIDTLTTGGLDYLSLSYYGRFDESKWDVLISSLTECQKCAQENDSLGSLLGVAPEILVLVSPSGKGKAASYAKWKFSYQGIIFAIRDSKLSENSKSIQNIPDVFVDISSNPLMALGESKIFGLIRTVFEAIGFSFLKVCPSRIDLCIDLVDVPTSQFYEPIQKWCYVSRTSYSDFNFKTRDIQTIYIGKKSAKTLLRIYDKYQECKANPEKYDLLKALRWGKDPNPLLGATRVEFQLRRQHLKKQHSINTYEDFLLRKSNLCKYLTNDWFRITEREPDPRHTERFGPSVLWQQVIQAFADWTGKELERRSIDRITNRDPIQLERQAVGCLVSSLAMRGNIPNSDQELNQLIMNIIRSYSKQMKKDIYLKRKELESNHPIKIVEWDSVRRSD
ncbi:replication initiation factor domain-containing protein [Gimesia aquarii]|uniref:Replication initiation factor n=1 Tax=Gimesia aquarii TaxID=2527964 RepID=A0A517VXN0_9PLAN|nr:replication initiation factor domain-containing protein [Gimesia aquarii]QDT97755.1 Replication initiation factor [Gimesia aquarii]